MKNVLVLLHDDDGQEARLQVALDLTRALSGHLTGLDVVMPPAMVTDYTGVAEGMVLEYACQHEGENRSRLTARLENEDVSWSMLDAIGSPGCELTAAAELADVIVVSSRAGEHEPVHAAHAVSQVAMKSHRLIFAVPPECPRIDLKGKALVAWDGSRHANEAMRAAVPLLQMASSVVLLEVNNPNGEWAADEAASYLSLHRIHAKVMQVTTHGSVSDAIVQKSQSVHAAYVVMGAYGPGRALEAIFGGITKSMLAKSQVPLAVAH